MSLILVADTETSGLTLGREKPSHPGQPNLVQLACIMFTDTGKEIGSLSVIIKPDGWTIPDEAAAVHGINTEMATLVGIPLLAALAVFNHMVKAADVVVAHNAEFDLKILMTAFHRVNRPFPYMNPRCTKDMADPIMRMPPTEKMIAAGFGWKTKPPKLIECIKYFFDEDLEGAHDALVDTRACARVFFEIERRKALEKEAA